MIKWVSVVPIALAMLFGVALVLAADAPTLEDRASAIERKKTLFPAANDQRQRLAAGKEKIRGIGP